MKTSPFSFVRSARATALAKAMSTALLLASCGSAPPPERLLRMPLTASAVGAVPVAPATPASPAATAAPTAATAATATAATATTEAWQLVLPIGLPAYLDHAALLVPAGRAGAGLEPLPGVRWAEPLRDAVPRLLRHDLGQLRGEQRLRTAPLPASLTNAARLRVDLVAFEAEPDGAAVRLAARWSLVRADGGAPSAASAELRVPVVTDAAAATTARAEALVVAHRQALRALAERIAATR